MNLEQREQPSTKAQGRNVLGLFRGAARTSVWPEQSGSDDQEEIWARVGRDL